MQHFMRISSCFLFSISMLTSSSLLSGNPLLVDHALTSIYAVHTETGEVLIDTNSDISMMPASCMKLVTTSAALHLIDPEYRFETHLEYDGCIDTSHILHGNIYIRGGGDPCLGSDRFPHVLSWKKQIHAWAEAIDKQGIQKIEGKIIGDATKWEKARSLASWNWEDIGNYYGASPSALSFHENCYTLFIQPGDKVGDPTHIIRTDPPLSTKAFHNEVTTGPENSGDNACIFGSEVSSERCIRGTIPAGVKEFSIRGSLLDPSTCTANLLAQQLEEQGLRIENHDLPQQKTRVSFSTTLSPQITEIVHWTNQKSINLYAEHLLEKMGEIGSTTGSTEAGLQAVTRFLHSQNIPLEGFNMVDGSGLSRKNLMTTKQLVSILIMMKKSKVFSIFLESLPQQEGLIRAKSGSMSFVKGYAGYAGPIAFAVFVNQCTNQQKMNACIRSVFSEVNQLATSSEPSNERVHSH